jgi:ketosteroid isomerase-like protein
MIKTKVGPRDHFKLRTGPGGPFVNRTLALIVPLIALSSLADAKPTSATALNPKPSLSRAFQTENAAQKERKPVEQQLNDLIQQFIASELRRDNAALKEMLTEDFHLVGPAGFVLNKTEWLGSLSSGSLKLTALSLEDVKLRVYNDSAIAIGTRKQTGKYEDRDVQGEFRETVILVRQGDRWRPAGVHLSNIAPSR